MLPPAGGSLHCPLSISRRTTHKTGCMSLRLIWRRKKDKPGDRSASLHSFWLLSSSLFIFMMKKHEVCRMLRNIASTLLTCKWMPYLWVDTKVLTFWSSLSSLSILRPNKDQLESLLQGFTRIWKWWLFFGLTAAHVFLHSPRGLRLRVFVPDLVQAYLVHRVTPFM